MYGTNLEAVPSRHSYHCDREGCKGCSKESFPKRKTAPKAPLAERLLYAVVQYSADGLESIEYIGHPVVPTLQLLLNGEARKGTPGSQESEP